VEKAVDEMWKTKKSVENLFVWRPEKVFHRPSTGGGCGKMYLTYLKS
jgi:hypothetical protein